MGPQIDAIRAILFGSADVATYALVDGASVEHLPGELWKHTPEHECLYRGALEPDIAAVAPYVVELKREHPFTDWLLQKGWGNHYATYLITPADVTLANLRRHFRRFTLARLPNGRAAYFRFYDPRVLQAFLPTCDREQLADLFGPVTAFVMERADGSLLKAMLNNGRLATQVHALAAGRVA